MLVISSISRRYPGSDVPALAGVDLTCAAGSFTTLLGPSGCGKSTLLRAIAGLDEPDSGSIVLNGTTFVDCAAGVHVPAHRRGIGMVFQSYAIWPHMSVAQNIGYPLDIRGDSAQQMKDAVREMLEMVGLPGLGDRASANLSGGQQQRVAIARAVISRPPLLLLDEPMSNLDAHLRRQLGAQLRALQRKLKLTVVYVTHDRDEALTLSDEIVVMSAGRIVDRATPFGLYNRPVSDRGALSVGEAAFLPAERQGGRVVSDLFSPPLACVSADPAADRILIRPEWITLHGPDDEPAAGRPQTTATITEIVFRGMMTEIGVELPDGTALLVRSLLPTSRNVGETVRLSINPDLPCAVHPVAVPSAPPAAAAESAAAPSRAGGLRRFLTSSPNRRSENLT